MTILRFTVLFSIFLMSIRDACCEKADVQGSDKYQHSLQE